MVLKNMFGFYCIEMANAIVIIFVDVIKIIAKATLTVIRII